VRGGAEEGVGGERERGREADSPLSAEPDAGLDPRILEKPRVGRLNPLSHQVPLYDQSL